MQTNSPNRKLKSSLTLNNRRIDAARASSQYPFRNYLSRKTFWSCAKLAKKKYKKNKRRKRKKKKRRKRKKKLSKKSRKWKVCLCWLFLF
jgi:hypothetical protein